LTHSLWLYPALAVLFYFVWKRVALAVFLAGSSIHAFLDFWVHSADAYMHFWPFTRWRFFSPVSYWNPDNFGVPMTILEAMSVFLVSFFLFRNLKSRKIRWSVLVGGMLWGGLLLVGVILLTTGIGREG
jgi:uncharacterized protein Usg